MEQEIQDEKDEDQKDIQKTKQISLKKETERSNLLAKKLQKESFHQIWEFYKAKEDLEKLTKGNVAAHFFYLGARTAFEEKSKDYGDIKKDHEAKKIEKMKTEKKLRDIRKNMLKLKEGSGLDIKETVKYLESAIKDNKDNTTIKDSLDEEIEFLKEYGKKKKRK
ncbi:MAG: hypothetical protein KAJ56_00540 [Candidatus Aenigmarchaeota archaeon]|nr:hypothetical protein [Candidatus Aenigmarchaeota archaeon]